MCKSVCEVGGSDTDCTYQLHKDIAKFVIIYTPVMCKNSYFPIFLPVLINLCQPCHVKGISSYFLFFIALFSFGCAGSWLLHVGFLQLRKTGAAL